MRTLSAALVFGCILTMPAIPPVAAGELFAYQPPLRSAPVSRVGAGARGVNSDDLALCLLAAPAPSTTTQAQPVIYWYAQGDRATPLRFTLSDPRTNTTLLTLALTTSPAGAVQAIRLAEHGITLEPDVDYVLILTRTDSAPPLQADAMIRRIYTPANLRTVPQRSLAEQAGIYAAAGVWYDAFAALSQIISDNTGDTAALHQQRAALLEQVKLPRAAAYERGVVGK